MQLYNLLLEWCRSFGAIIRSEGQESTEGCQGHCSMLLTPAGHTRLWYTRRAPNTLVSVNAFECGLSVVCRHPPRRPACLTHPVVLLLNLLAVTLSSNLLVRDTTVPGEVRTLLLPEHHPRVPSRSPFLPDPK